MSGFCANSGHSRNQGLYNPSTMNARDLLLMITYHFAATVILYLMAHHAGHVWVLMGWSTNWRWSSVILACDRCSAELPKPRT